MAKKIEYPTGNRAIDWLLENERNGLNEDSVTPAIRFLIDKFNELVCASQEATTSTSALPISDVVQQREQLKGFVDWFNKTDKTQSILNKRVDEYIETL
jgi:hypothetical protein